MDNVLMQSFFSTDLQSHPQFLNSGEKLKLLHVLPCNLWDLLQYPSQILPTALREMGELSDY